MTDTSNVLLAFLLTALAGLSTGIGSALALVWKHTNRRFLAIALGSSAGVMIYVSFVELFPLARRFLAKAHGEGTAGWLTAGAFFGGILISVIIDRLVPSHENPHEARSVEQLGAPRGDRKLMRVGVLTAVAIGIHNFPEGLATFAGALSDLRVGVSIAVAVAIHNIPEGIAVAVPIYHATGDRRKAFWYSFLSGVSEPVGALAGYLILRPFFSDTLFGVLFGVVAGIMVFISLDELLPSAHEHGEEHAAVYGLVGGMAVMAVSLLLAQ